MSYGKIKQKNNIIPLKKIECRADVTNNFGIFTLKQRYYNDADEILDTRYIFPFIENAFITEFIAKKNDFIINSIQNENFIEAYVGDMLPKEEIVIEITYLCEILIDNERTRIIIPTVIPPRYVAFGEQIAFESVVGRTLYTVTLDLTYRNINITNVISPTHEIISSIDKDKVNVSFKNDSYSDRDIIIDIFTLPQTHPKMFYAEKIISCYFRPEIDVYERHNREYLFMLDISDSMLGERLEQAKNALLICIRALQKGDKFNVLVFCDTFEMFSDEALPLNDDTLKVASKWIMSQTAKGKAELISPIVQAYKNAINRTVLLISGSKNLENDNIITYAKNHSGAMFYTFGINHSLLSELSEITGGLSHFIKPYERIDDSIVKAFNIIASPSIKNAVLAFDVPVQNITPSYIKTIHYGANISVMAKVLDKLPRSLTIQGERENTKCVMQVDFDKVIDGGSALKHQYELRQNDVLCKKKENSAREKPIRTKTDTHFVNLCKSQRASGRFMPKGSRSKENIGFHTAKILYEFCAECPNVEMYIWHLRKTASFLLDYIENNNSAVIPKEIVKSLSLWHEILGGNDEISQKVAVLRFLNREK